MPGRDFSRCANLLDAWAPLLAEHCGRPTEEIRRDGLRADDFENDSTLVIRFFDGCELRFNWSFCLVDKARGELAVFTEHLGYHVFPSDAVVTRVREEVQYRYGDEEEDGDADYVGNK